MARDCDSCPDCRSATLAVRSGEDTFRGGKRRDSKGSTNKGKGGKSGKGTKGSKSKGKGIFKGKGDPLKQRLVSRTQCRLCGEKVTQADVDTAQAKRRVTFARPLVGTSVSQACDVKACIVSPSTETAETRLRSRTSQELQESTNLMGVTMTMPEGYAILDCGAALD